MFCLFLLLAFTDAQKLFDLKSFAGGKDTKIDVPGPYSLYVSASSDPEATLKNVFVKTSDNRINSLWQLKNHKLYQNSGLLEPLLVDDAAWVSTVLSDEDMSKLKGYLYVTSSKQLNATKSSSFIVYDVSVNTKVQIGFLNPDDVTQVFLNSDFTTTPWQSSTITFWQQDPSSRVKIYEGIPSDDVEKDSTEIFSNPLVTASGKNVFFPKVEQFSLSLGAFYVKSHMGVSFIIQPKYTDLDGSQTSAMTSTGLYMKPYNSPDRKVTVTTLRDTDYNGTVGANVVGSVPDKSSVAISENDGVDHVTNVVTPVDQILGWSTSTIGQNLTIESVGTVAGEFFVQFYVIQGAQISGTTLSGRQTTARVETTTRSSNIVTFMGSVLIPLLGSRLL